jgi:Fe-S-cluster-containing dehydrogenase component
VRAICKREQDGIVLVDQDKCQGFRECNKACPCDKVYFNCVQGKPSELMDLLIARQWNACSIFRMCGWLDAAIAAVVRTRRSTCTARPVACGAAPR